MTFHVKKKKIYELKITCFSFKCLKVNSMYIISYRILKTNETIWLRVLKVSFEELQIKISKCGLKFELSNFNFNPLWTKFFRRFSGHNLK